MTALNVADALFVGSDAVDKVYLGTDEVWSAASSFDPRTQVAALHAMWAEDPDWTNPGDGNPVTSWRNHSGGGNPASTGGNRPTYRASTAAFGNRPTVQFVNASSQYLSTDITDVAQPFKLLIVASMAIDLSQRVIGRGSSNTGRGFGVNTAEAYNMDWGSPIASATGLNTGAPHVFRITVNGASSEVWVDGVSVLTGNPGTTGPTRFTVGAGDNVGTFGNYLQGHIAFVGIYAGATSDVDLATLAADLKTHYGL